LLKRLEVAGLIKRQRSDDDERMVRLTLTPLGARLTQDIGCVPPQVMEATQMQLSEILALTAKLNQLAGSLREHAKA
jgi:DNA-binding MarR family transcriptional regulator